jgi:hypothetical protein
MHLEQTVMKIAQPCFPKNQHLAGAVQDIMEGGNGIASFTAGYPFLQ